MTTKPLKIAVHLVMFILVMVVMRAVAIWLGLGPVVISR